jgi:CIC family chloride channel protein
MNPEEKPLSPESSRGLLGLSLLSLLTGATTGLLCAMFRLALEWASRFRDALILVERPDHMLGLAAFVSLCAAAAAASAWLVRRFSIHATGSGIPHVEAVLHGLAPPAGMTLIPVKFFGGLLAMGAGLFLGREGPSVQMGASISQWIGKKAGRGRSECRELLAAGAGAGLATAFNAPIAGAIFVLEELVQRFEHRIAILALGSSASAIAVARFLIGDTQEFQLDSSIGAPAPSLLLFLILGLGLGLMAIFYNWTVLKSLTMVGGLQRYRVETRAAVIGAGVACVAWVAPGWVGGGEPIIQRALSDTGVFLWLFVLLAVRHFLGALCYAAGTPGGVFAPMLALGALSGQMFGRLCLYVSPDALPHPGAFALVGMTALFSGVTRAPLTGIVLVTEMSGDTSMLLPMLLACFAAMLPPTLMGATPLYESLRLITLEREAQQQHKR